jgi:hypothetical protein
MKIVVAVFVMLCCVSAAFAVDVPYCEDPIWPAAARCWLDLDNSGPDRDQPNVVYLDNASSMSNARAAVLVRTADRSTRNAGPAESYRKGLMKGGDRVCITPQYLAWFDYTLGDGIRSDAPLPMSGQWARPNGLAGIWTLDPATGTFRFPVRGGFARNELIPGSASPGGQEHFWDVWSPPIEHTIVIPTTDDPQWAFYFFSTLNGRLSLLNRFMTVADGVRDSAGVHYKISSLLTSWKSAWWIPDSTDANLVGNTIETELEYVCRPNDILMVWNFRPTQADVVSENVYFAIWLAYGADEDDTPCDVRLDKGGGLMAGNQWPDASLIGNRPVYARSNQNLMATWNQPASLVPAGGVSELLIGTPCQRKGDGSYPDYVNYSVFSFPGYQIRNGSWIEVGASPALSSDRPRMRLTVFGTPNAGRGTKDDPFDWLPKDCSLWSETVDGTIGAGCGTAGDSSTFKAGQWYRAAMSLGPS